MTIHPQNGYQVTMVFDESTYWLKGKGWTDDGVDGDVFPTMQSAILKADKVINIDYKVVAL